LFTAAELASFADQTRRLNDQGRGDQIRFILRRPGTAA
jgi:hypothetical protein